ncbi:Kinesin- motor protein [Coemansia erecta]|nr:Kinesin- motor protein [Coemansia erecta]
MQGYNCTIFAYGQTGTGKTYTMEGDLDMQASPSVPSTPAAARIQTPSTTMGATDLLNNARISPKAGVIPRTLYNLFYALDKQSAEFYVRVSYVELYNEELRDLLSNADANNGEVRGFGGGYESSGSHLKVYESGTDKGVIIQGLEEKIVSSAKEAVALMQAGAMRRKVAATRCNDSSSRSHAIFTVTVYIRERAVTAEGEDIVKLGKLNLVDLAGSENIGRSGAQNIRAWEAGNINKSLLVLGRVINALVERNSYVPYRDSKLTYILKDSLGGRTRTCMIATISTSVDNIEETVKTLQYASQAKGIRNRPVANKKVSKSEIVHDMQHQIEQLKRDLEAARDGSGFYVTKESYDEMVADKKIYKEQVDEWRQRVLIYEDQVGQLNMQVTELTRSNRGLEARVAETEEKLGLARENLEKTQGLLNAQVLLTRAHAFHERSLDDTARLLHASLGNASRDSEELHQKIARMGERERMNLQAVESIGHKVARETERAAQSIARYAEKTGNQAVLLLDALRRRVGEEFESGVAARMREHMLALQTELGKIAGDAETQKRGALEECKKPLGQLALLVGHLENGTQKTLQLCDEACAGLEQSVRDSLEQQSRALHEMTASAHETLALHGSQVQARGGETQALVAQILVQMEKETRELEQKHRHEISQLQKQVEELREHAVQSDQALLKSIGEMLGERKKREVAAMDSMLATVRLHAEDAAGCADKMLKQCSNVGRGSEMLVQAVGESVASASARVGGCIAACVKEEIPAQANALVELALAHGQTIRGTAAEVAEDARRARENCSTRTAELQQGVESLSVLVDSSLELSGMTSTGILQRAAETADQAIESWRSARGELDSLAQTHKAEQQQDALEISRHVAGISETVHQQASTGVAATVPGGATPPRRAYDSVDRWSVTQTHEYILARLAADFASSAQDVPEALEWTGIRVLPEEHRPMSRAESPAAMSDEMHGAGSDTPVSAASAQTLVVSGTDITAVAAVAAVAAVKPLRKRTSDTAVSSATDSEMQPPPTRKARTRNSRNTQSSVDMDQDDAEDDADVDSATVAAAAAAAVSGIPRPASRIQAPRRTRRTRG